MSTVQPRISVNGQKMPLDRAFRQARDAFQQRKLPRAEKICQKIVQHQPKHDQAFYLLSLIALRNHIQV